MRRETTVQIFASQGLTVVHFNASDIFRVSWLYWLCFYLAQFGFNSASFSRFLPRPPFPCTWNDTIIGISHSLRERDCSCECSNQQSIPELHWPNRWQNKYPVASKASGGNGSSAALVVVWLQARFFLSCYLQWPFASVRVHTVYKTVTIY